MQQRREVHNWLVGMGEGATLTVSGHWRHQMRRVFLIAMTVLLFFTARATAWPLDWGSIGQSIFGDWTLPGFFATGQLSAMYFVLIVLTLCLDSSRGSRRSNAPRVYWGFIPEPLRQFVKNAVVFTLLLIFVVFLLSKPAVSAAAAQIGLNGQKAEFPLRNVLCFVGLMCGFGMFFLNRTAKWRDSSMSVTASSDGRFHSRGGGGGPRYSGTSNTSKQSQPRGGQQSGGPRGGSPQSGGRGGSQGGGGRQGGGKQTGKRW